jgi:Tfp pilus assembly protein PilF
MFRHFKTGISLITAIIFSGCGSFSSSDKGLAVRYLQVGTSQLESGNFPQALSSLLKAESLDSDNPVIQNNLGLAYFVRDHFKEAIDHIQKAIEIKSDYTDAYNNLGRVLIEVGDYQKAIAYLEKSLVD